MELGGIKNCMPYNFFSPAVEIKFLLLYIIECDSVNIL